VENEMASHGGGGGAESGKDKWKRKQIPSSIVYGWLCIQRDAKDDYRHEPNPVKIN
jgi:hypothetical protein